MLLKIRQLILGVGLFSFAVLFLTGFGPVMTGSHFSGYWLMAHMIFTPVFIGSVALVAVLDAERYRSSVLFWFLLLMALPLALSMVLSMFPVFGTEGLELLLKVHRICALVFSLVLFGEIFRRIRKKRVKSTEN